MKHNQFFNQPGRKRGKRIVNSRIGALLCGCLLLISGALFTGCGGATSPDEEPHKQEAASLPSPASQNQVVHQKGQKECYNMMVNGDTVVLTVKWLDTTTFTGSLLYQIHEKDRNIGTLEGKQIGSVLLADYVFQSEGVTSTRQVAFKQLGDYLVEGYGPVVYESNNVRFERPDSLTFDLHRKLMQVKCL